MYVYICMYMYIYIHICICKLCVYIRTYTDSIKIPHKEALLVETKDLFGSQAVL